MPDLAPEQTTVAVDTAINSDGYMTGLSNPVTADEIMDIYSNPRVPTADRVDALRSLRQEMVARQSADTMDDMKSLISVIDEGLTYLKENGDGFADPDVLRLRDTAVDPENL